MRLGFSIKQYLFRFNSNLKPFYGSKISNFSAVLFPHIFINLYDFYIQNTFVGGSVRSFRYIFGLPVNGQRTWSNSSTCFTQSYVLYNFKFNKFKRLFGTSISSTLFLGEYINLFLQQQWFSEWFSVAQNLPYLPFHVTKHSFIDIHNLLLHNIYTYYNSPFKSKKAKSHRKKRTYPRNKVVTGLPFGFSFIYQKQLKFLKLN